MIVARLSQHAGDGGLAHKKITLDLQLPDLPMQIVDHVLRITNRSCLAATREQFPRTLDQFLLPAADHRRMHNRTRQTIPRSGLWRHLLEHPSLCFLTQEPDCEQANQRHERDKDERSS